MSSLGSIDHVLKAAFKAVYDEDIKRRSAVAARIVVAERAAIEAERLAQREAEMARLALEAEEEAKKSKGKKKDNQAKKEKESKVSKVVSNSNILDTNNENQTVNESLTKTPSMIEKEMKEQLLAGYFSRFEQLNLNQELREEFDSRSKTLNADLISMKQSASELLDYLDKQREKARNEEQEEEDDLKRQGIIIGQHIPSIKSRLFMDQEILDGYGPVADNLLIASTLMNENHVNMLRRSGNMQITEAAEKRALQRIEHQNKLATRRNSFATLTMNPAL